MFEFSTFKYAKNILLFTSVNGIIISFYFINDSYDFISQEGLRKIFVSLDQTK